MTLSNKKLMALSQFALKAKPHIGLVKAGEMLCDPHYAYNIIVKATLSNSAELVKLSKKITNEFHFDANLVSPIEAYMQSLNAQDCDAEFLHDSQYFLIKLSDYLYSIPLDGAAYREAVKNLILNMDKSEKTFCVDLARAFYWFWKNPNSSHEEVNLEKSLKLQAQQEKFSAMWDKMDALKFSDVENWPLTLYVEYMRKRQVSKADINTKHKIAKAIMLELRHCKNAPQNNYRAAVNSIQHLFAKQKTKDFFLIVSREYFHFWVGNLPKQQAV